MDKVIGFMQSNDGRLLRVVLGIVIIVVGAVAIQPPLGYIVMLVGLLPLTAGLIGVCMVGLLFGYTLAGDRRMRQHHV